MVSILFVCLGNICRSPAAEGVLKHMIEKDVKLKDVHVKSCGLGNWHEGQLPDHRMRENAKFRGIDLVSRAQVFQIKFYDEFDYILAADHDVRDQLLKHAKDLNHKNKVHLITAYSKIYHNQEIPDPYYQGNGAFDHVLNMIEDACEGLVDHIKKSK